MTRRRLADESGFTLVELLAAMTVGMIVMFALYSMVDTATRQQARAVDRIDVTDRARYAMDAVGSRLRSRVCVSGTQGSLVAATANSIEYFASFAITPEGAATQRPVLQRRRLTYDPATATVVEDVWTGAAAATTATAPAPALTTTATQSRTLLTKVEIPAGKTFLSYYKLSTGTQPTPSVALTPPLTTTPAATATIPTVARIDVNFSALGGVSGIKTQLQNQIIDRSPRCYFG